MYTFTALAEIASKIHPDVVAAIVAVEAMDQIGSRITGLLAQFAALIAGSIVLIGTCVAYWKLLTGMFKAPSWEKLAGLLAIPMVGVFFVGMTPDLLDLAYEMGASFLDGSS